MYTLVKENDNFYNFLTQNIKDICETIKTPNPRIIGIQKGEESLFKGPENTFNKIIEKNFKPKENTYKERHKKVTEHQIDCTRKQNPHAT